MLKLRHQIPVHFFIMVLLISLSANSSEETKEPAHRNSSIECIEKFCLYKTPPRLDSNKRHRLNPRTTINLSKFFFENSACFYFRIADQSLVYSTYPEGDFKGKLQQISIFSGNLCSGELGIDKAPPHYDGITLEKKFDGLSKASEADATRLTSVVPGNFDSGGETIHGYFFEKKGQILKILTKKNIVTGIQIQGADW